MAGDINTSTQFNVRGQRLLFSSVGNLFAGEGAGASTVPGNGISNAFFGTGAGDTNTTGDFNTIVGTGADVGSINLNNATAIGSRALVTQSNSLVLGSINGQNGATDDTNVGIGTTAPSARLHVAGASSAETAPVAILQSSGSQVPLAFRSGATEVARIRSDNQGNLLFATVGGAAKDIYFRAGADDANTDMFIEATNGNVGIGTTSPTARLSIFGDNPFAIVRNATSNAEGLFGTDGIGVVYGSKTAHNVRFVLNDQTKINLTLVPDRITMSGGVTITGNLSVLEDLFINDLTAQTINYTPADSGVFAVCAMDAGFPSIQHRILAHCGSSIRYKTDVRGFAPGLDLVSRLRPVNFRWKKGGMADFGLIAEEVERVEPLLVTRNDKGEVEGVKYDRIGVLLLNAVQEQQTQIKAQEQQLLAKDERIANLAARLARYESNLALYESRLASLELSTEQRKRTKRRVTTRAGSTRNRKPRRASASKAE
ncbi:MAG: tail fiber domain-containing protein [Rubrivivax sp.]|nr:tail fiber domain-containing protein [Pyrinomonadaceae bacterium]